MSLIGIGKFRKAWHNLRGRCTDPNIFNYSRYGGRGISYDPNWDDFTNFFDEMYPTYKEGYSLDRIDPNGNYCKENCRWVEKEEQHYNKTNTLFIEFEGEKVAFSKLCRQYGIKYSTASTRYHSLGWSAEDTFKKPVKRRTK